MKFLLILIPCLSFGQITVRAISSYPDSNAPYDSMQFIAQQTPNSPVIYKKMYGTQLRGWINAAFDTVSGCGVYINCDSTGHNNLVRRDSATVRGLFTNTGRDTTTGRGAWHGAVKSDSSLTAILLGTNAALASSGGTITAASTSGTGALLRVGSPITTGNFTGDSSTWSRGIQTLSYRATAATGDSCANLYIDSLGFFHRGSPIRCP